jgi:GST-like protein
MTNLSSYEITAKWPAKDPNVIQLYSFPTPNGVKVSIALEEMGLAYEAHKVTLSDVDVKSPEFLSLNPNNKIPAIIDPNGPDGTPIGLFESGAILIYLAEKTDKLIGSNPSQKAKTIQWLMFQMGGLGPMFGQLGFFSKFAGSEWEDKRPQQRYIDEGKHSIADIAIAPWLRALDFYGTRELLGWSDHKNLVAYLDRFVAREAVQKGLVTPARD